MSIIYINPYQFAATGPTDPDFANVSLLLHGDGTNGSTTIVDSSPSPKTVTAFGDAQISTAQSRFGGASIVFDGSGDYLSATPDADYAVGTGDFTVEAWIYPTSFPITYNTVAATRGLAGNINAWSWSVKDDGTLMVYTSNFAYQGTDTGAVALNTWSHVALVRSGTSLQVYVDGVANRATPATVANDFTDETLWIGTTGGVATGGGSGGDPFTGYIDDLRITKGVARYTSNFTPPTAPFPDA
jgi:hypothetical protein